MSVRSCTSLQDSQQLAAILSFEVASMADPSTSSSLGDLTLDAETYVALLGRFISVADQVQNAPSIGFIPRENVISDLVLAELSPYSAQNGGPLTVERVEYVEGRGNVIITYQHPEDRAAYASSKKSPPTIAFMGSHMDVVPADPETWERNPFSLVVEGDRLYGRGTTDCLGHVALMTQLFIELAKRKVKTKSLVVCVLIASEENTEIPGVGVETLMEKGRLDFLKDGPVIWTDSSNSQPRIGTAGVIAWTLTATGKLFHSGLPNQGINAIELAMDAVTELQKRFYADFGPVEEEKAYNYACPSTMKPARAESAPSGLNQIPPWAKITGDVRLSPFYDMQEMIAKVKSYVDDLNADLSVLEGERGPSSKYVLPGGKVAGHLQIEFEPSYFEGIACSLEALSYKALYEAIEHVKGEAKPFSISGSLPLVRDLQRAGFDLILIGFGLSTVYHADNEYCLLSDMQDALKILARTIANVENSL